MGSGSVGGAIAIFCHGGKPKIVYETRQEFPIQQRMNHSRLFSTMSSVLEEVANSVAKNGLPILRQKFGGLKIDRVVCVFSSPWHVSTTRSLHFNFEKPFKLSPHFITDILDYESKNFLKAFAKDRTSSFYYDHKAVIVEQEILRTLVNGYPVAFAVDKEPSEFELDLFMSAFPRSVKKVAEKIIGQHYPHAHIDFRTSTSVFFHALSKLYPDQNNLIVAHIGGETTDVSVVKGGVINESVSFPLGKNFVARRLMDGAPGLNAEVALSMIKIHNEGNMSPKLSQKSSGILNRAEEDWVALFADSMRDFSKDLFLPTKVLILSGNNSAKTFADFITARRIPVRGGDTPPIIAEEVSGDFFEKNIEYVGGMGGAADDFLAMEVFYLDRNYFFHGQI